MVKTTFVMAMMKHFGRKPQQTLPEFSAELKELTLQDREDLSEMLKTVGYDVSDTPQKVAAAA